MNEAIELKNEIFRTLDAAVDARCQAGRIAPCSVIVLGCSTSEVAGARIGKGSVPDLLHWTDEGVLLLNATLTVAAHRAGSHQGRGWETFSDSVVRVLNERREKLVFILWGAYARRKGAIIDRSRHCVIESAHPSPLSAYNGFFGSRPFAKANEYLTANGIEPVDW